VGQQMGTSEKEQCNCIRCGRSEIEVKIYQRFADGDFCGIADYFICADCESEYEKECNAP
jgi:hypothetical protein